MIQVIINTVDGIDVKIIPITAYDPNDL